MTTRRSIQRKMDSKAYEAWFCAKVREALNDPGPAISDDAAREQFAIRKNALRKK